ncbi:MAG: S8 family peptidase [Candidatus Hodarchaeales archaeon]|jgi:subtilisin family serine protease
MKKIKKMVLILAFVAFLMTFSIPVKAGNVFKNETSTKNGYSTWDSDMINIEKVGETGKGVYVAVLDTGLAPNWKDYFPEERIAEELGIGFYEELQWDYDILDFEATGNFHKTTFIGSRGTTHGTHVTSTIIGYFYDTIIDTSYLYEIPPIMVRGIAPEVTIIPVKVLADYQVPANPKAGIPAQNIVFGTDRMVAAGIQYIADLAEANPNENFIISMSLGGEYPDELTETAIDNAIGNGVIVVAAAGNEGTAGMSWPGAYSQVVSVGAVGWRYEWWWNGGPDLDNNGPTDDPDTEYNEINFYYPFLDGRNRLWWLQSELNNYRNVVEGKVLARDVYVAEFSSRELRQTPYGSQELDVLAPGSWVRGPYPGTPGYAHLPWWSNGLGSLRGWNPGNYYYVGGTSMATPHVSAVAALMLEKNPNLVQSDIEKILKDTTLRIDNKGVMTIVDALNYGWDWTTVSWNRDATGAGLIQADKAVSAA